MNAVLSAAASPLGVVALVCLAGAAAAAVLLRRSAVVVRFGVSLALLAVFVVLGGLSLSGASAGGGRTQQAALAASTPTPTSGQPKAPTPAQTQANAAALQRAEEALTEAERVANTGQGLQARDAFKRAADLFRAAGDKAGEGRALLGRGRLEQRNGQGQQARDFYSQAEALFVAAGDKGDLGRVLIARAEVEWQQFKAESARDLYLQALTLLAGTNHLADEATAEVGLMDAEWKLEHIIEARRAATRAGAIAQVLGDTAGAASARRNLADMAKIGDQDDGPRAELMDRLNEAIQLDDGNVKGGITLEMANFDRDRGRLDLARAGYNNAQALYEDKRNESGAAQVMMARGDMLRATRTLGEAKGEYDRAAALFKSAGDKVGSARVQTVLGQLANWQDPHSRQMIAESAAALTGVGDRQGVAYTVLALCSLDQSAANLDAAREGCAKAYAEFLALGDWHGQGQALLVLADIARDTEDRTGQEAKARQALALFEQKHYVVGEGFAHYAIGDAIVGKRPTDAKIEFLISASTFDGLGLRQLSDVSKARFTGTR